MPYFNIRVYGIFLTERKVLLSLEQVRGAEILKFPGGGLEFGEGLKDCLRREWMEELAIPIKVGAHFYTTDFYQRSAWDDSQVISVYYFVHSENICSIPLNNGVEVFDWYPVDNRLEKLLTLPIDKIVGGLLFQNLKA